MLLIFLKIFIGGILAAFILVWLCAIVAQSIETISVSLKSLNRIFQIEQDLQKVKAIRDSYSFKADDLARLQEEMNNHRLNLKTTWKHALEVALLPFILLKLLPRGLVYVKKLVLVLCDKDLEQ